jgi:hypothetical protein
MYSGRNSAALRSPQDIMISTHSQRAKSMTAGAILLLLAVVAVAPPAASAGCGHDVVSRSDRSIQRMFSELSSLIPASDQLYSPSPLAPRRDLPCSGPACSQGSRVPSVPASTASAPHLEWCCTTSLSAPVGPLLIGDLPEAGPCCPLHRAETLVRPPRNPA